MSGLSAFRRPLVTLLLAACLLPVACSSDPQRDGAVGTAAVCSGELPAGPYLYCISNLGRTLRPFGLTAESATAAGCRLADFDPVGTWFHNGYGFYLSRVEGGGAGSNALAEFDPVRLGLTGRRVRFAPNANPNSLLVLPDGSGLAWVGLRGSTFDSFDPTGSNHTNGLAVVNLDGMAEVAYRDLNVLAGVPAGTYASLLGFHWDPNGCGGAGCAYAVVNNWHSGVNQGRLLVLEPGAGGLPVLRDDIALGTNPFLDMVVDAEGELWVVNNGGHVAFCFDPATCDGEPGTVQVLDTAAFADGLSGNETAAWLAGIGGCAGKAEPCTEHEGFPPDPTGIYAVAGATAWLTTYPDDRLYAVDLAANDLAATPATALPATATGPLYRIATTGTVYGARNGFATAGVGRYDPAAGSLLQAFALDAGQGPLTCGYHEVP